MSVPRTLPLLLVLALAMPAAIHAASVSSVAGPGTWTVMVYMANDFEVPLSWEDDINEMEGAVQRPGTTVVALVDDYGPDNTVLLQVLHDPNFLDPTIVSPSIDHGGSIYAGSEADMASAETLRAFIDFTVTRYPAERYALILWGHGAGWRGVCPDGHDLLNLRELGSALQSVVPAMGHELDLLVIDSCALATVELLAQRLAVGVIVASEKDVPYAGLPYTLVLDRLAGDPEMSPEEFGEEIARTYVTWSMTNSDYSTTMAVLDNAGAAPRRFLNQLLNLSDLGRALGPAYHAELVRALEAAEEYEMPYTVDLGDFARRLMMASVPLELRYAAYSTLLSLNEVVSCFVKYDNPYASDGIRVMNATGLAIYAVDSTPYDAEYLTLHICDSQWDEFAIELRNSTLPIALGPDAHLEINDSGDGGQTAVVTWGPGFDFIRVWVFQSMADGLAPVDFVESSSGTATISGCLGRLVVSAGAYLGGVVRAHSVFELTLEGMVSVVVEVRVNGEAVTEGIDVTLLSSNASVRAASVGSGLFSAELHVPSQTYIGELVRVEVRDHSTKTLLGETLVRITAQDRHVSVELSERPEGWVPTVIALTFALMPALLIIAFALLIRRELRGRAGS